MTKVCFINTNHAWGGGEKWHFNSAHDLKKHNFSVHFISADNSALSKKLADSLIPTTLFKINKYSWLNPFLRYRIKKFLKKENFDTIILNLPNDVKMFASLAHKVGVKKIIYRRGMNHPIKNNFINRLIYPKYLTHIVANSEDVAQAIISKLPQLKSKISIIYNGIDCQDIKIPKPARQNQILIGNLGRLTAQKGQKDLIKIAKILNNQNINFKILIAGEGELLDELQSLINQEKLQNQIELLGNNTPEEFFEKIDYFIFPSRFEGLSNALLEAIQFQKAIICYNIASNSEIITDQYNGFLIPPFETELMANKIIELSKNSKLYEQIQNNSKIVLTEKFDKEKMLTKLIELIK